MNRFIPQSGTIEEWSHAHYRVEDYLRAHGLLNKLRQTEFATVVLERAAAKHARDPSQSPTTLALQEAMALMDEWFRRLVPAEVQPERVGVVGRVGIYILDAPERWPALFACEGELPAEWIEAMRQVTVQAGPDLSVSSMVPRPVDVTPLGEMIEQTWERLERAAVIKLVFVGGAILGALWFLFRF